MRLFVYLLLTFFFLILLSAVGLDYLDNQRHRNNTHLIQEMHEKAYRDRLRIRELHKERNMAWWELNKQRKGKI